jgi:hypothetical protein
MAVIVYQSRIFLHSSENPKDRKGSIYSLEFGFSVFSNSIYSIWTWVYYIYIYKSHDKRYASHSYGRMISSEEHHQSNPVGWLARVAMILVGDWLWFIQTWIGNSHFLSFSYFITFLYLEAVDDNWYAMVLESNLKPSNFFQGLAWGLQFLIR